MRKKKMKKRDPDIYRFACARSGHPLGSTGGWEKEA
jgi:hypothetical protein